MGELRALGAPVRLVVARVRRRPARWLLPAIGIALATAFAAVVAGEGTIAGDQAARSVLAAQTPLARTIDVTWQGPLTPAVPRQARSLFAALALGQPTRVVLLSPVRLDGLVVRPAAIAPLASWLARGSSALPGPCTAADCPVLLVGGASTDPALSAHGVRLSVTGAGRLASAAPLGFSPPANGRGMPVLVTGDAAGLSRLAGLSGVYRTQQWLDVLRGNGLRAWQLSSFERRLQQAEATLLAEGSQFAVSAPFGAIDAARAQAGAAPNRLRLAGGGALAALALFLVLAIGGLRSDLQVELARLRTDGARRSQCAVLIATEAGALTAIAVVLGAAVAVVVTAVLAGADGEPVSAVLTHSIVTGTGLAVLAGGWVCSAALVALLLIVNDGRLSDLALAVAAAALVVALEVGSGSNGTVAVLLAPLCCLAAGVVLFRAMSLLLPVLERAARRGPLAVRLSFVTLARSPASASLAIAFVAVAVGLGGFALSYRATLLRGAADEAANAVPMDAIVSPGPDFVTPLVVAPLARWRSIAGGSVWPVRRTDATYALGYGSATVPALGIPAAALAQIRGWRTSDGSAPLATLARRLVPDGTVPLATAALPARARSLLLEVSTRSVVVTVTADLRLADGTIRQVPLGVAAGGRSRLRARLPELSSGASLEALELEEPTGLDATNGHQNGENVAASTQSGGTVMLGPMSADGVRPLAVDLGTWVAVGAASRARRSGGSVAVRFDNTGQPGLVRPAQEIDSRPLPVLVDPGTDGAAARSGLIELTVDGLPVRGRVVGVLKRVPTIASGAGGFVIADESTLSAALESQLPGQGRPSELWFSNADLTRLRAALRENAFAGLSSSFRGALEGRLRDAPVARAVLGTLIAATAVAGALAIVGLLVALLGAGRDRLAERDLAEQGVGPRELRRQLRLRLLFAAALGVIAGLALAWLLTTLAVAAVRAAGTLGSPQPPLVTVTPALELVLWGVIALAALTVTAAFATRAMRWRGAP